MPLKIYYLDDEPDLLEMFADIFSSPERTITTFTDPQTAVETANSSPPDIMFFDYRLPNATGDELALKVPTAVPKALVTGDMNVNLKAKFDAVFSKPYKPDDIENFINTIASKKRAA